MLKNFFRSFKSLFKTRKKNVLRQEALLRLALREWGINDEICQISIDHISGKSSVNNIPLGLIYPYAFFEACRRLQEFTSRDILFVFEGFITPEGGRKELLEPFIGLKNSLILNSSYGRSPQNKFSYNFYYFQNLSKSFYGLCPHQIDWPGPSGSIWTYRFVECCMSGSIPVVFNKTPLSSWFTDGFYFITDLDAQAMSEGPSFLCDERRHNFDLAFKRFTLHVHQANSIIKSMPSILRQSP